MTFLAGTRWIELLLYVAVGIAGSVYACQVLWSVVKEHVRLGADPEERTALLRDEYRRKTGRGS